MSSLPQSMAPLHLSPELSAIQAPLAGAEAGGLNGQLPPGLLGNGPAALQHLGPGPHQDARPELQEVSDEPKPVGNDQVRLDAVEAVRLAQLALDAINAVQSCKAKSKVDVIDVEMDAALEAATAAQLAVEKSLRDQAASVQIKPAAGVAGADPTVPAPSINTAPLHSANGVADLSVVQSILADYGSRLASIGEAVEVLLKDKQSAALPAPSLAPSSLLGARPLDVESAAYSIQPPTAGISEAASNQGFSLLTAKDFLHQVMDIGNKVGDSTQSSSSSHSSIDHSLLYKLAFAKGSSKPVPDMDSLAIPRLFSVKALLLFLEKTIRNLSFEQSPIVLGMGKYHLLIRDAASIWQVPEDGILAFHLALFEAFDMSNPADRPNMEGFDSIKRHFVYTSSLGIYEAHHAEVIHGLVQPTNVGGNFKGFVKHSKPNYRAGSKNASFAKQRIKSKPAPAEKPKQ